MRDRQWPSSSPPSLPICISFAYILHCTHRAYKSLPPSGAAYIPAALLNSTQAGRRTVDREKESHKKMPLRPPLHSRRAASAGDRLRQSPFGEGVQFHGPGIARVPYGAGQRWSAGFQSRRIPLLFVELEKAGYGSIILFSSSSLSLSLPSNSNIRVLFCWVLYAVPHQCADARTAL